MTVSLLDQLLTPGSGAAVKTVWTPTPTAHAVPQAGSGGTIADLWLSSNVPLLNAANTFTANQTITGNVIASANFTVGATGGSNTNKSAGVGCQHYNGTNNFTLLRGIAESGNSRVYIGGGTSAQYAATNIQFRLATDTTTTTGTSIADVTMSGWTFFVPVIISGDVIRITTSKTPASAGATGSVGQICWDSSYLYICIATNTWRRIAHSTW